MPRRLRAFLFPTDSGRWLSLLRVGLGLQVTLYAWSLRADWPYLFGRTSYAIVNRRLNEAILSAQAGLTPRLGWLIEAAKYLGLGEGATLSLVWLALLIAAFFLLLGFCCRSSAIVAWFLYLCSVKSGLLFAYGVDNFTTIGLFYLMIAPLPDRWSLDRKLGKGGHIDPERLGFHQRVLQLHLCAIYLFGGISKSLSVDWWNGTSIWRALTRPPFDLLDPDVLIHFHYLLPAIGILVCLLETGYPMFIWMKRTRTVWLAGICFMHLSIGLTMGLYLFALIMIVLNLAAFGSDLFCGYSALSGRRWLVPWHNIETRETR